MKTKLIKSEPAKDFKPFKIKITVETIQEARALYHVANNEESARLCFYADNYSPRLFTKDYNNDAFPDSLYQLINDQVTSQGFKI